MAKRSSSSVSCVDSGAPPFGFSVDMRFETYSEVTNLMSIAAVKAETSLAKTCRALSITEKGKRWLDCALDPFKDLNMPTAGFPDSVVLPSVIETIHDSISVSVPASAGAGLWDCNVFLDQLYSSIPMFETNYLSGNSVAFTFGQGVTPYTRGGLQVRSGPAGSALGMTSSTGALAFKSDVIPEADVRIVGLGLEIHNTTAELQKQGALITYRIPDTPVANGTVVLAVDNGTTACISSSYKKLDLIEPPATAGEAIDMPGSLQWEAKDGAYVVAVLDQPENPPLEPETNFPLSFDATSGKFYAPALLTTGTAKLVTVASKPMPTAFSLSGVYLTGLSNSTTLQVNLTYYVEIFPTKNNVLRRVSQPSTTSDPNALKLYGQIVSALPTGVMVAENFLGGFISGVARIASGFVRYAPQIARVASGAVEVVNTMSDMINGSNSRTQSVGEAEVHDRVNSSPQNDRQIVVYQPQKAPQQPRGTELISVPKPSRGTLQTVTIKETPVSRSSANRSVQVNNGTILRKGEKGRKRQNQAIRNAIQGNAGNRWVG